LVQLLRLEPPPDALAELPAADAMLVGRLVHRVLQKIVSEHQVDDDQPLDRVVQRDPVSIPWPDGDRLRDLLTRESRALLRAEGIATPGFERVLIDRVRACVDLARSLDWPGAASDVGVLGAEVEGSLALRDCSGQEREIRFYADRVDRTPRGLRLIDYKTGNAVVNQKRTDARRRNLLKNVSLGRILQAAAYAMSGSQLGGGLSSEGRYLYLGVDTPEHARITEIDAEDRDCSDAFARTVQLALDAWDRGSFIPRLVDSSSGKEPWECAGCAVKEACLRGDSGSRLRLEHWVESTRTADAAKPLEAERAALGLWNLGLEPT
jgi:hypothetical protein